LIGGFNGTMVIHPGINSTNPNGITAKLNELLSSSYAVNTIRSYNSKMKLFITFLNTYSLLVTEYDGTGHAIPEVTPTLLMFFCVFMIDRGQTSSASITGCCAAVKQWCLLNDRPNPVHNPKTGTIDMRHHRLHRAIKRKYGTKSTKREPLSVTGLKLILRAMRSGLIVSSAMIQDYVAAMLLGFYAMLRVGEYTNLTTTVHNATKEASRGDVEFFGPTDSPDGFRFVVKCSKTTQFRTIQTLTVYRSPDTAICPVKAMYTLFKQDPRANDEPLFDFTARTTNNRERTVSAARSWYVKEFQKAILYCGLSTAKIQSHSLRSGGATAYLAAGIDPYIVQRMGRWRSFCWTTYTWTSTVHIKHAMEAISTCVDSRPVNMDEVRW
jgi:hypothetical protein